MARFFILSQFFVSFLLGTRFLFLSSVFASSQNDVVERVWVGVGLVLDMGSLEGKIIGSSVSMALSDFYAIHSDYKTRISLSFRDSHGQPLLALVSAEDLLQNVGVEAIIGGQSLLEAKLLAEIGEKARVPVISIATPISLSLTKYTHFIQATHDAVSEAKGITAFLHDFDWNNVALVYEDDDDWRESMQLMVDNFHDKGIRIGYKDAFTVSSTEDSMMEQLRKLNHSGTTVLVVHLSRPIAAQLFLCAAKLGMMGEGFAWIFTAKSINTFQENFDHFVKEAMEGVVVFKPYIPFSKELHNFTLKWRRSMLVEEDVGLSISGIWAHDIAWALARAVEVARLPNRADTKSPSNVSTLLTAITQCKFKGLSGGIRFHDNRLLSEEFEIVNMIGSSERRVGFWNRGRFSNRRHLSSTKKLETIIWPGGSVETPKRQNLGERSKKKLNVLVTSSNRFPRLMEVHTDNVTGVTTARGFCIEVFQAAIAPFNYELIFKPWTKGSNYDNLAYELYSKKDEYDVAVGDITITCNRTMYVDFTLPFTEMGLGIVAPKERSIWLFFQPLTPGLWLTSAAFFVLTGIIVWLIERNENTEFQGSWPQQVGVILWFGFSTLVYAHRERLKHNLSRFVVIVWVFAVLILTTSYTATLTSMMTVQQIRFNSNKDYVGHLSGSLIAYTALTSSSLREMRSKGLNSSQDYAQAMLNKTVAFVVDEIPYLKILLGQNPADFVLVKTQTSTNGFGFMFQKGSKLTRNVSREIAKLRTSEKLNDIEKRWFEKELPYLNDDTSNPITLYRFRGLFMITGIAFTLALGSLFIFWLRQKLEVLVNSVLKFFAQQHIHFQTIVHPIPLDVPVGDNAIQMVPHSASCI